MIISLAIEDLFCFVLSKLESFPTILWTKPAISYCVFGSFWPCFSLHLKMSSSYSGCKISVLLIFRSQQPSEMQCSKHSSIIVQIILGFQKVHLHVDHVLHLRCVMCKKPRGILMTIQVVPDLYFSLGYFRHRFCNLTHYFQVTEVWKKKLDIDRQDCPTMGCFVSSVFK